MIEVRGLTKRYGARTAVDGLTFAVREGCITGFLGPNGAGKSTTLAMMTGLVRPDAGEALIDGRPYADWPRPMTKVGAVLDATAFHPGRTVRNHLRGLARCNGLPDARVDEVLGIVGLQDAADRRGGQLSLGMGQRLGLAAALLGDPEILLLDEPLTGLDPEGVQWLRRLLKGLSAQGRTILLSSHLMAEAAQTVDDVVIIGRGRLLADAPIDEIVSAGEEPEVLVRTPQPEEARRVMAADGLATTIDDDAVHVHGGTQARVGALLAEHGVVTYEVCAATRTLEDAYMALTGGAVEFRGEDGHDAR